MRVTSPHQGQSTRATTESDLFAPDNYAWLIRLCTRLVGDPVVAEDLAQETLIESWQHLERLRDPSGLRPWLAGVARNVYRRWVHQRAKQMSRTVSTNQEHDHLLAQVPDDDALAFETELDREELATLLDRALGLLPAETRDLLIQYHVDESSHAEIAERLGLSQGTLAVRLHRGRLSLRRVLADSMSEELAASGIIVPDEAYWHPTSLWCRYCGTHKLVGRVDSEGMLTLRCPHCCRTREEAHTEYVLPALDRAKGFKTMYRRLLELGYIEMNQSLGGDPGRCPTCGTPYRMRLGHITAPRLIGGHWGIQRTCPNPCCHVPETNGPDGDATTLATMNLSLPEGRCFWRTHSHLLALPEREVEHEGVPAIIVSFQDMESPARLDVISHRDTFTTLGIHHVDAG